MHASLQSRHCLFCGSRARPWKQTQKSQPSPTLAHAVVHTRIGTKTTFDSESSAQSLGTFMTANYCENDQASSDGGGGTSPACYRLSSCPKAGAGSPGSSPASEPSLLLLGDDRSIPFDMACSSFVISASSSIFFWYASWEDRMEGPIFEHQSAWRTKVPRPFSRLQRQPKLPKDWVQHASDTGPTGHPPCLFRNPPPLAALTYGVAEHRLAAGL